MVLVLVVIIYVCNHFHIRLLIMMRWRTSTNGTMPMESATWSCCWRRNGARALSSSASATRYSLMLLGSACSAVSQVGATPSGNLWKFVFGYFVVFPGILLFHVVPLLGATRKVTNTEYWQFLVETNRKHAMMLSS